MQIIPAIDLQDGQCVRLRKGDFDTTHTVADDPLRVAADYRAAGAALIHVVDLDGAKDGARRNAELVRAIVKAAVPAKIELGGGLRSDADLAGADALGVYRFVLGSAAAEDPSVVSRALTRYGPERVAAGIDALDGRVKTRGWREDGGLADTQMAADMAKLGVQTLIYTDIATDGELGGPSLDRLRAMKEAFNGSGALIASGGVSGLGDVEALRDLGMDGCIIGKALYSGAVDLREALFAGQWETCFAKGELLPAVVQDSATKDVLMLGYMDRQALRKTLETGLVTFFSRSRQTLWTKGETSGNTLRVVSIAPDCDRDTLLVTAVPAGPTCHTGHTSCFYEPWEVRE